MGEYLCHCHNVIVTCWLAVLLISFYMSCNVFVIPLVNKNYNLKKKNTTITTNENSFQQSQAVMLGLKKYIYCTSTLHFSITYWCHWFPCPQHSWQGSLHIHKLQLLPSVPAVSSKLQLHVSTVSGNYPGEPTKESYYSFTKHRRVSL